MVFSRKLGKGEVTKKEGKAIAKGDSGEAVQMTGKQARAYAKAKNRLGK
ncbi:hypothetical protein [Kribbella speibonae]|nr:hypothetical protein [Kribbella speibonae]